MLLDSLKPEFQRALRLELAPTEELLWVAQPDPSAIPASLLMYSVLWLSGLFLMSVALLRNADADVTNLRPVLIGILVLVALVGAAELIFLPMRAARTFYAVTTTRVLAISIGNNPGVEQSSTKTVLRDHGDNKLGFCIINIPAQILLFLSTVDVVIALTRHFDPFFASGFGLIITGWIYPWIQDLNVPLPRFRDAPRTLYTVDNLYVSIRELPRDRLKAVKLRRISKGLFNVIMISRDLGCLRLRAIRGGNQARGVLQALDLPANEKFPFD